MHDTIASLNIGFSNETLRVEVEVGLVQYRGENNNGERNHEKQDKYREEPAPECGILRAALVRED